jgi:hypothetical protein
MSGKARVDWNLVREELLSGMSVKAIGALYGMAEQTIRNKASVEGWEISESRAAILKEAAEGKAREIELALDEIGSRLKGASIRARVKMAEQVEKLLEELAESEGMGTLTKSRCLASLAQVAEKVHRWSGEPTATEMEGLKTAAVNLRLIRTSPEELRLMARRKALEKEAAKEGSGREGAGR